MRRFRKIIIENVEYKWFFRKNAEIPYLLIAKKDVPEKTLRIKFPITEFFILNSGLPATFQGKEVIINLNQPFYISQIIQYCRNHVKEDLVKENLEPKLSAARNQHSSQDLDGIKILEQIGYHIHPSFTCMEEAQML